MKITKKELIEALEEQRVIIEKLIAEKSELEELRQNEIWSSHNETEYIRKLEKKIRRLLLENIADLKTVENYLKIYQAESMTHREKAYLGNKLIHVMQMNIDEKIKNLSNKGDEVPF